MQARCNISEAGMGFETHSTCGPVCPYCGHKHQADEAFYYDEDFVRHQCHACDKTFRVSYHRTDSWRCEAIPSRQSRTEEGE